MLNSVEPKIANPNTLAPPTVLPKATFYSWFVKCGNFIVLAGMSPYSKDKRLIDDPLKEQARQAFRNIHSALDRPLCLPKCIDSRILGMPG